MERVEFREQLGANVEFHAIFTRHGEKKIELGSADTDLTEAGRQGSRDFGAALQPKDAIKGYASGTKGGPVPRTHETAGLVVASSPTANKKILRTRSELALVYDPAGRCNQEMARLRREILGENFDALPDDEKRSRLRRLEQLQTDQYLSYGEVRPDDNTYCPEETAATMARRIQTYIEMVKHARPGSKVDLINATHDLCIAAFLKEMLGFDSIEDIGGPIKYNEAFEINIKTDDSAKPAVTLLFRDKTYSVDWDKFRHLLEVANRLNEEL